MGGISLPPLLHDGVAVHDYRDCDVENDKDHDENEDVEEEMRSYHIRLVESEEVESADKIIKHLGGYLL